MSNESINTSTPDSIKKPTYKNGIGWRYETEHRMTRWPDWKDSRLPGTYMLTLNINGGQKLLGKLEGKSAEVRQWMKSHTAAVKAASDDDLYYRHALLGNRAMPFVLKADQEKADEEKADEEKADEEKADSVKTEPNKESNQKESNQADSNQADSSQASIPMTGGNGETPLVHRRFNDGAPTSPPPTKHRKTHFPIEALKQPDAPHIVLSPLGKKVLEAWQRMPIVVPQIEQVVLAIMPNHLHAIIAVKQKLPKAIGSVIRSFMGTTSHALHQMMTQGTVYWDATRATTSKKASIEKPSLWESGYCVGICQTETNLHTRIGYVIENPFFGILEQEEKDLMQRVLALNIAGRRYAAYGNLFLLKEPERIQVFCHRKHPVTGEPYHLTQDFQNEKSEILRAANNGAVIVTPGISPGEADIMWSVLRTGGNVINIQKEEILINGRWHPEKERRIYCSQGKMLVLSIHDLPKQVLHNHFGEVIPTESKYARFHLLNFIASEICAEGVEHTSCIQMHI